MIKLNKKAGEKVFSLWWFVCIAFVGVAIVIVVTSRFGAIIDTRDKEIMMLQEKIMDCIVQEGYLNEEILEMSEEEFLIFCNLNKNQFTDNSPFLFNITIYDETQKEIKSFLQGHISYQEDCKVAAGKKTPNYPFCIQSRESVVYLDLTNTEKKVWSIYLLVASNNNGYKTSIVEKGASQ